MNKKTIIIGAFSILLITGGVAGTAAVLINGANVSKDAELQNNKVIFTKDNMLNLRKALQTGIDDYKLTRTKFSQQNYIDIVKNNLFSKDTKVAHLILDVKLNPDTIEISLNKRNEYDLDGITAADNLATYNSNDKIITLNISSLKFYSSYQIENLIGLYDLFNDKVLEPINLYTSNEFQNYINNNENAIKSEIAKALNFIITTRSIDSSAIKIVMFDDNLKQLQITLNDDYIIYDANSINNPNVALNDNIITISNFDFYTSYQVSNSTITDLQNVVQNYINLATNQYTIDEFNDQLDSQNFKIEIANYLTIPESVINRIEYTNDTLKIIPTTKSKFVSESSSVLTQISVTNLRFYIEQDLINLENLYTTINNYILDSTRKFTVTEFNGDVQFNNSKIKDLVAQNLYISQNQKIDPSEILNVSFNETLKQFEVNFTNNYKKYNLTPTNNVSLKNNQLIISNFTFYEGIEIEPTKLDNFQTNIQCFINELTNQYTLNEFTNQIDSTGFKNLIVASLGIPSAAIDEIKFENSTLSISTTDMKKFVSSSTSNILVNGEIKVNDLKFYTEQSLVKLDNLYNSINNYIINANRKFTSAEFSNYTNTIDNNAIKNLVAQNLYISETETINASEINSVNFNETTQELEIELNNNYKKYSTQSNANVEWKNGKLIVKNFTFYTAIEIDKTKLDNFQSFIQNFINLGSNQFTKTEFTNQIDSEIFKDQIANYLQINKLLINNINFSNNTLTIQPLTLQKFSTPIDNTTSNNLIVNGNIVINSFQFFTEQTLVKLDTLYNTLNSYITAPSRKYTSQEFTNEINTNNATIKNLVLDNLYTTDNDKIDPSKVSSVSFNNQNQLEITFVNDYIKYQFTASDNFEWNNYKLIVKNLTFYNGVNLSNDNLNNLQNSIQDYINKPENQYLLSEFEQQLNSTSFKQAIANALSISADAIGNITFTNDLLKIQPNTLFKFIPEFPNNIIVNENIQIQNLLFYNSFKFINLNNLYNVINDYITNSSRKFSYKEFSQDLKTNLDSLKLLIAKNLVSDQNANIGVNDINSLSLNNENNLVITLNNQNMQYFKYTIQENNNVFLEDGNKLVVKNLTYYTDLTISDDNLISTWHTLNNFVIDNQVTYSSDGDINNYLNSSIWNIIKELQTIDGLKLENFINKPTNSGQIISVTLKSGMYKMKSKNLNFSSIIVENNSKISFNQLYIQSPSAWFNWSGNQITGLSSKGRSLVNSGTRNFVLPVKTTKISGFSGYSFGVEKIDMSYSNITSIDSNSFHNNNDLLTLLLPKKLTSIGYDAFDGTRKLTTVFLPSSLSSCGSNVFNRDDLPNPNRFSNFYVESNDAKSKFINLITPTTPSNYFFIGNTSNIYYFY